MTRPPRKAIPLSVKLAACLHLLKMDPKNVEWDHCPALGLRPVNDDGTDYDPPQLDPRYIVPMLKEDHRRKTDGDGRPLSGDKSQIAKVKRVQIKYEDFRSVMLGIPRLPKPKRSWPKRKFERRRK